jgi:hypothetical protein
MRTGVSTPAGRRAAVGVVRVGGPSKHHASKYNTSTTSQWAIDSHRTRVRIESVSANLASGHSVASLCVCVFVFVPSLLVLPGRSCSLRRKGRGRPGHGGGGPSTRRQSLPPASLAKPWAQWRHSTQLHSYGSVERSWDYQPLGRTRPERGIMTQAKVGSASPGRTLRAGEP